MQKWIIQRPSGGITLNDGYQEALMRGGKVLTFPTRAAAVKFLISNGIVKSKSSLEDSSIKIVRQ